MPELTVAENIFLGRELGHPFLRRREMNRRAQELLNMLGLDLDASAIVRGLSIARAATGRSSRGPWRLTPQGADPRRAWPATLSVTDVHKLFAVLRRLRGRGLAVIDVSHRLEEVFEIADTVTVLRDGRHVATSSDCRHDARGPHPADGRQNGVRGIPAARPDTRAPRSRGRAPERPAACGRRVARLVRSGEIVGLAGLVGAGKNVRGAGDGRHAPFRRERAASGIARPFPNARRDHRGRGWPTSPRDRKGRGLFPSLGVDENITMAHLGRFARAGWLSLSKARASARGARCATSISARPVCRPAGRRTVRRQPAKGAARAFSRRTAEGADCR